MPDPGGAVSASRRDAHPRGTASQAPDQATASDGLAAGKASLRLLPPAALPPTMPGPCPRHQPGPYHHTGAAPGELQGPARPELRRVRQPPLPTRGLYPMWTSTGSVIFAVIVVLIVILGFALWLVGRRK
jgi:hypothetical protein